MCGLQMLVRPRVLNLREAAPCARRSHKAASVLREDVHALLAPTHFRFGNRDQATQPRREVVPRKAGALPKHHNLFQLATADRRQEFNGRIN